MASRRIYVLGAGNIGCLIAHSLKASNPLGAVSLCLPRQEKLVQFRDNGNRITVERNGIPITHYGFGSEVAFHTMEEISQLKGPELGKRAAEIKVVNLIVATKAPDVVRAMKPLRDRIDAKSTVLFLHNGMGVLDNVYKELFPSQEERPRMMLGITTHGAHPKPKGGPFHISQVGMGSVQMGIIPREGERPSVTEDFSKLEPSTQFLLNSLLQCQDLDYCLNPYPELLCLQLEKLAANAVINALTVLFNCFNGELLFNMSVTKVMRLILFEVSRVAKSMPEIAEVPNRDIRFAPETLEKVVVAVLHKTAKNISSMLQDIRAGKSTEIDYINGFIADRGVELGIPCAVNYMLTEMVHAKEKMIMAAMAASTPMERR